MVIRTQKYQILHIISWSTHKKLPKPLQTSTLSKHLYIQIYHPLVTILKCQFYLNYKTFNWNISQSLWGYPSICINIVSLSLQMQFIFLQFTAHTKRLYNYFKCKRSGIKVYNAFSGWNDLHSQNCFCASTYLKMEMWFVALLCFFFPLKNKK